MAAKCGSASAPPRNSSLIVKRLPKNATGGSGSGLSVPCHPPPMENLKRCVRTVFYHAPPVDTSGGQRFGPADSRRTCPINTAEDYDADDTAKRATKKPGAGQAPDDERPYRSTGNPSPWRASRPPQSVGPTALGKQLPCERSHRHRHHFSQD